METDGWVNLIYGGYGAYTSGEININEIKNLFIYVGGSGEDGYIYNSSTRKTQAAGWNGGGTGGYDNGNYNSDGGGGGGSTDIRLDNGDWNNEKSLNSRIMVAAGGGGGACSYDSGYASCGDAQCGSGLYNDRSYQSYQISTWKTFTINQTTGYAFGYGMNGINAGEGGAGGGGGYYGGLTENVKGTVGGGGSSYISGHTGCVAISSEIDRTPKNGQNTGTTDNSASVHYSGYYFTNTIMIDGAGYKWTNSKSTSEVMPNPNGGTFQSGTGNRDNGYARITIISADINN